MANESALAYNAMCSAQSSLERLIDESLPDDDLRALREIRYELVSCRERMIPFAFPELYPRERTSDNDPMPPSAADRDMEKKP